MHLSYSMSRYKGKIYKSYALAESYRDGDKVRKRTIWKIGKLTDVQAAQIKLICQVTQDVNQVVTRLQDVAVTESKAYLDLAVVNELWDRWELDKAFEYAVTGGALPTNLLARILTMNRCCAPCSHYSISDWAQKVALAHVLHHDLSGLNDDKIYYELDKIHRNKPSIEHHIFDKTFKENPESYEFIDYDLTTSYFVGCQCNLSAYGKGKIECHGRRQVLLGVLINDVGYPFKWDVYPGNTAEVKTLKENIHACKTRFQLGHSQVTMVFDRGILSGENADVITEAKMKYISALDRNQISSCGICLDAFSELASNKKTGKLPKPDGFSVYDENLSYKDEGVIDKKRYVVGFNPILCREDRRTRKEKLRVFDTYLQQENENLKHAQRDRTREATEGRVVKELHRLKIKKYYDGPVLHALCVHKALKDGTDKEIQSFKVEIKKKEDVIQADQLLDGVCVFVTNHTERYERGFTLKSQAIIRAYRNKAKIEDVFKNVKSFLKLRPFFVNTDEHVSAVYTICMIAYFLNRYLSNQRKLFGEKDFLNSKELYAPFKDIDIVTLKDATTGRTQKKGVRLPKGTENLLEKLGLYHIVFGRGK